MIVPSSEIIIQWISTSKTFELTSGQWFINQDIYKRLAWLKQLECFFDNGKIRPAKFWPGARFSKVPRTFRARKAFVKSRPAYSVKLIFSHVVKGIKIKITEKFRASRRLRFEDTKRIMSPEIHLKSFGTFEKQAPEQDLNPDLCNVSAVINQLSYHTHWEMVITWVHNDLLKEG